MTKSTSQLIKQNSNSIYLIKRQIIACQSADMKNSLLSNMDDSPKQLAVVPQER